MENTIKISNLSKRQGQTEILKDLTFVAKPGRVTAFLGPNGAGKSSTLRILLGLDQASSGSATIDGRLYRQLKRPLTRVGASFDGIGAPEERKVSQQLKIVAASNGISYGRIEKVLQMTGMTHKAEARIGHLSLGEGQRLGIATSLLGDPQFLILDEPTNGLDPAGIRWFRAFIQRQAQRGKTILLSSHILAEVEQVTDDIVLIHQGRVLLKGTLEAVMGDLPSLEAVYFSLTDGGAADV